jgi:hypothetical protein
MRMTATLTGENSHQRPTSMQCADHFATEETTAELPGEPQGWPEQRASCSSRVTTYS